MGAKFKSATCSKATLDFGLRNNMDHPRKRVGPIKHTLSATEDFYTLDVSRCNMLKVGLARGGAIDLYAIHQNQCMIGVATSNFDVRGTPLWTRLCDGYTRSIAEQVNNVHV